MKVFMTMNEKEITRYLQGTFEKDSLHDCADLYDKLFETLSFDLNKRVYWGFANVTKELLMEKCTMSGIVKGVDDTCMIVEIDDTVNNVCTHDYYEYSDWLYYEQCDYTIESIRDEYIEKTLTYMKSCVGIRTYKPSSRFIQCIFQTDKINLVGMFQFHDMEELYKILKLRGMIREGDLI